MWASESVFYQIYPFGACGAPFENDHVLEHRIHKLEDFIPHLKKLNINNPQKKRIIYIANIKNRYMLPAAHSFCNFIVQNSNID